MKQSKKIEFKKSSTMKYLLTLAVTGVLSVGTLSIYEKHIT